LDQERRKRLDLLGGLGAAMLGAGVALLFAHWLRPYAIPALLIGIALHGWAMFQKGRLERDKGISLPPWPLLAEWLCWILLALLAAYMAVDVFGDPM
jgi:hypothetical protein